MIIFPTNSHDSPLSHHHNSLSPQRVARGFVGVRERVRVRANA